MPFVSEAQRRWMHARHPEMAKEWERATPPEKKLPERAPETQKRAPRPPRQPGEKKP